MIKSTSDKNYICPENSSRAIGMFDSGVGGLTVLQQVTHLLPNESVIYFGDTARVPYGEKSGETIVRYSFENSNFLTKQGIKLLVIACHTASSYAAKRLQEKLSIPVIDVIAPSVQKAVQLTRNGHIAILGTKGTIRSQVYQTAIQKALPAAQVTAVACPLFVPLVEEHLFSHAATRLFIHEYLAPLKKQNVDTVLLGCTHYPLLRPMLDDELGPNVNIIDPAKTCAEHVQSLLQQQGLSTLSCKGPPMHKYYVSDDPEKFRLLGEKFLGRSLEQVQAVNLCD